MKFTLLAFQLVLAMAFEYDFQAHDHSEALDELAVAHGLSFHSKALSGVRGRGISTGEYRRGNSRSNKFLTGTNPRTGKKTRIPGCSRGAQCWGNSTVRSLPPAGVFLTRSVYDGPSAVFALDELFLPFSFVFVSLPLSGACQPCFTDLDTSTSSAWHLSLCITAARSFEAQHSSLSTNTRKNARR